MSVRGMSVRGVAVRGVGVVAVREVVMKEEVPPLMRQFILFHLRLSCKIQIV